MIAPARVALEHAHAVGQITGYAGSRAPSWRYDETIVPSSFPDVAGPSGYPLTAAMPGNPETDAMCQGATSAASE